MSELEIEPVASPGPPLIDLHIHVGGAVAPHILFSIAHSQGFKLPVKDYWEFVDLITANPKKVKDLDDYLKILHEYTEKIQSSPAAIERSVYEIIGKEFRGSHVNHIELRFNPMKRNLGGERDLDHIIHAAIRGMDRATLEYNVQSGLIFCLAREFSLEMNEILVDKAIKYKNRGVIGIDIAGSERNNFELRDTELQAYARLFAKAKNAGLGTTIHTGETTHTGIMGMMNVLKHIRPDRIGHGIWGVRSTEVMSMLKDQKVVLELCPTSNLHTHAILDIQELKQVIQTLIKNQVLITINTDGPYALNTNMKHEVDLLLQNNILTQEQINDCFKTAQKATFVIRK